jgi:hypothetical protein
VIAGVTEIPIFPHPSYILNSEAYMNRKSFYNTIFGKICLGHKKYVQGQISKAGMMVLVKMG